ncbi:MAG: nucleotidyl transferase AbiEii/AbiGii toxin family protein [Bacteroidales bacterium]|nr:nucleotidyl transferase AbiEii/AbiGii toxin family protein [Bacteroidales bacterium]
MFDINRHRFYMVQILKNIYSDIELSNYLGFKGGTALMFFYELPRFSVDLDFDLLNRDKAAVVYDKLRKIILKYGSISDEAQKFFGQLIVLDYGKGERKLKIEISNRLFENHYEIKSLFGINVKVMTAPDMFAHKLCALLDRGAKTNRDIFDIWFFMEKQTPINKNIVETRIKIGLSEHISNCINYLESIRNKHLLDRLGELMDQETKQFVKTQLLNECIGHLKFYEKYPILN